MENASKALIIAAEVLIGVMILSIGVYLFSTFAGYSADRYKEIEDTQIAEFNNKFLKFYGTRINDSGKEVPIECTIHDIISLANLAQKNNLENELIEEKRQGNNLFQVKSNINLENSLYVQIDLGNIKNLELKSNSYFVELIKEYDLENDDLGKKTKIKYYKCTVCEPKGNNKRINYVKFEEIK